MTEQDDLIARLDEQLALSDMGYSERFEYHAERFYRATGSWLRAGEGRPWMMRTNPDNDPQLDLNALHNSADWRVANTIRWECGCITVGKAWDNLDCYGSTHGGGGSLENRCKQSPLDHSAYR